VLLVADGRLLAVVYIVVAQVVAIVRPLVPIMFVGSPECWPGSVLPRCVFRGAVAGVRSCSALLSSGALTRAIAFGNSRFVFAGTCTCKAFVPKKKRKEKKKHREEEEDRDDTPAT
jgi:hypothetical protein